jgi:putative hemolysin
VSNHPLGAIDGVTLGAIIGREYDGHVKYLMNDLLMNLKGMAPLGIPINKLGGQARNLVSLVNEAYQSDNQMLIFPAGLCSRKIDGKIQDIEWSKSFIKMSRASGRDIVPIHFIGENSKRFYRIATWQKRLGLKFNIAMLYLSDEMFKNRNKKFKVTIGKPIPWQTFDKSKTATEWAQHVQDMVYAL